MTWKMGWAEPPLIIVVDALSPSRSTLSVIWIVDSQVVGRNLHSNQPNSVQHLWWRDQ